MPEGMRIAKFVALTDAKKVVTATDKGIITDEKIYDDGQLQLAAAKELAKLCGDYPADRVEVEHTGGVAVVSNVDDPIDITNDNTSRMQHLPQERD